MTTSTGSLTSLSDPVPDSNRTPLPAPSSGSMVARSGMVLTGAVALAGAGNYATNALLARRLTSEAFGDAASIVALMLGITAIAGCLQLSVAAQTAQLAASPSIPRLKEDTRRTWFLGSALAAVVMLLTPTLTDLLNMANSLPFIVFAAGIPFQLNLAVRRGRLQGELRFTALGRSFIVEMVARLIATWVFLELWAGAEAAAAGVTVAFVMAGLAAALERDGADVTGERSSADGVPATSSVPSAATLLAGHMLLASTDLLLVKASFSSKSAGTYAVVALVGRGLLFCGSAVANTVFPISARDPDSPATRRIEARSMSVLSIAGAVLTAGAWLVGGPAIDLLFDGGYPGADRLIGPFMLGTTALVLLHFLASVDVAAGRSIRARVILVAGVLQSIMIMSLEVELEYLVWARTAGLMAALLVVVSAGRSPWNAGRAVMTGTRTSGRRILLLGTHGQSNVGDELLLQTFLQQLGSEHQYEINSYDPSATAATIDDAFSVQVFDTGSGQWRLPIRIFRNDLLVFAGGSIVKELTPATQRWRYSTLSMVLLLVTFARQVCRKPVLFSNVGVGPLASRPGRLLAKLIVTQASFVATRDRASKDMCLALGLDSDRVQQVPDAVFVNSSESFGVHQQAERRQQRPLRVALNLNHDVKDEKRWEAFLEELRGALEHLAIGREIEIIALPMQSAFKNDNDLIVLRDFLQSTSATAKFPVIEDHRDVARVVADVDVLVAERLHAIVIAAIVGVPVVALPYSTKVTELVDQLSLTRRSFSVEDSFSPTALSGAIVDAAISGERERSRLRWHSGVQQAHLEDYFASVRYWIANPVAGWPAPQQLVRS